jgi:ABC-type multidrug transport system fused ATPase/permease subunit
MLACCELYTKVELQEATAQQLLSARWYSWWRSLASSMQTTLPLLCTAVAVRCTHRSSSSSSTTTVSSHSDIDAVSGIMAFLTLCALRHTLAEWPAAVRQLLTAARAIQRLQQFLLVQEVGVVSGAALTTAGVSLDCCTFVWNAPTLMSVLDASTATARATAAATAVAADAVQRELELTRAQLREADRAMLLVSVNTPTHGKSRTPSRTNSSSNSSSSTNISSSSVSGEINNSVTTDSKYFRAGSSAPQRRQLKGHKKSISWTPNSTSLAAIARIAGSSGAVFDDCYSTDSDTSFSRANSATAAGALFCGNSSNHYSASNGGSSDSSSHPSTPRTASNGTHTHTFNTPSDSSSTIRNGSSTNFSSASNSSHIAAIPAYIRTASTLPTPLSPVVSEGRGTINSCADCSAESSVVGGEPILALSRVTLEVGLGQFVGIVGPRKSGKSTLLAAIMGAARR